MKTYLIAVGNNTESYKKEEITINQRALYIIELLTIRGGKESLIEAIQEKYGVENEY